MRDEAPGDTPAEKPASREPGAKLRGRADCDFELTKEPHVVAVFGVEEDLWSMFILIGPAGLGENVKGRRDQAVVAAAELRGCQPLEIRRLQRVLHSLPAHDLPTNLVAGRYWEMSRFFKHFGAPCSEIMGQLRKRSAEYRNTGKYESSEVIGLVFSLGDKIHAHLSPRAIP